MPAAPLMFNRAFFFEPQPKDRAQAHVINVQLHALKASLLWDMTVCASFPEQVWIRPVLVHRRPGIHNMHARLRAQRSAGVARQYAVTLELILGLSATWQPFLHLAIVTLPLYPNSHAVCPLAEVAGYSPAVWMLRQSHHSGLSTRHTA